MKNITETLNSILNDDEFEIYGRSSNIVETFNVGSGQRFEIHYYEDGEEIEEAFFCCGGEKIELDSDEINQLRRLI